MTLQTILLVWGGLCSWLTILIVLLKISMKLENRFGGLDFKLAQCMSREEHEQICIRREADLNAVLARIEGKIDENEKISAKTRHDIRDTVHNVQLRVAVMESRLTKA